jgi:hypothetical protein
MRSYATRWLVTSSMALALAALIAVPERAVAGLFGKGAHGVATVAVPVQTQHVQTQYVTATPVYVTRAPLFPRLGQRVLVNTVAAPATTSLVTTSAPMVTTSYVVTMPTTVTTTAPTVTSTSSPQVTASQSGQVITLTVAAGSASQNVTTSLTQGLVADSVVGEAPYLQGIFDGAGRGTIAGLIKAALRKFIQSLGPNGANKDLLKQIATFLLQNAFGGSFAFDFSKALPEIDNIINSLLNEQKGGSGSGTIPPGNYPIQGTFTGTITIGSGGNGSVTPPPPPPPPSGASDPSDRDTHPSRSPFGSASP